MTDKINSLWSSVELPQFKPLDGDIKTDVLIIGGGLAGILCAYMLTEAGVDCALAEAKTICSGVTKNTTAKVTFQHGLIFDKLIKTLGENTAKGYLAANRKALEKYKELCWNIDCDFEEKDSYVYSLTDADKIKREVSALKKLGCDAQFVRDLPLPLKTVGAVKVGGQAQFNPLKFVRAISPNLKIYEHTKVLELTPDGALTNHGKITAKRTVVATHFPILNKHGGYFIKMYQDRSYVIALENAADVDGMYIDESGKGLSFRNYGNLLLFGGGSRRTGKSGGGYKVLEKSVEKYYPDAREVCRWATQDCMTLDGMPYIGRYSENTPRLFVATGFNKWGMTSSMVSAMIIRDLICKTKNPYAKVFSPSRSILHPQLAANILESTVGLLTPTVPRCPHLGCALKYNSEENSWDCPCHGSRFTKNGQLINGPATDDKNVRK